jgi:Pyruvate dehydrogenase complex, dehydrogenase (E1) component
VTVNDQDPYSQDALDSDPEETAEWQESLQQLVDAKGRGRGREVMLSLLQTSHDLQLNVPQVPTTDYINTIAPGNEPEFPGDEELERRYRRWIRWNAAITVHRAQRPGIGVGGHISTYASSASLYEVGFNHFFRGHDHPAAATRSSSRGMPPPESTRARSSRGASARRSWTASARRSRRRRTDCPPTRTRGSCRSTGSSRPCRWGSGRSTPSTRR